MNSLIGDSRARGLKTGPLEFKLHDNWFRPGAKISHMHELARDCVIMHHGSDESDGKLHIYLLVGICDITSRCKEHRYEETIFDTNNAESIVSNAIDNLNMIHKYVLSENAIPIICTIYPLSLISWNSTRRSQNKTSNLQYLDQYVNMQPKLESTIEAINNHIFTLNKSLNMSTPDLAKQLKHNRSKGHSTYRYNLLIDGLHPAPNFQNLIIKSIAQAIDKNRSTH
jgi:hypothetical protein